MTGRLLAYLGSALYSGTNTILFEAMIIDVTLLSMIICHRVPFAGQPWTVRRELDRRRSSCRRGKHQPSLYQGINTNVWESHMTLPVKRHSPPYRILAFTSFRFRSHLSLEKLQLPPTILKMSLINEVHDSLPCMLPHQ